MKKKILVVDDELISRKKILRFLEAHRDSFETFEAENGLEALSSIEQNKPDIVFLDIEMPEMNGMDLVHSLPADRDFQLIFQTAYSEYAVEAFEKNAIDYLLKPYSQDRFNEALDKAMSSTSRRDLTPLTEQLTQKNMYLSKVVVKRGTKNTLIPVEQVLYFRSENHYTYICTDNFEYIHSEPLKDWVKKLDPNQFQQVHRNAILNLSKINEVIEGENMQAVMSNGEALQVSRSNRKKVKELIIQQGSASPTQLLT